MYIWECKIGAELDWETIPKEIEEKMRQTVMKAFRELTGESPYFCFSGWGAELEPGQKKIIERRQIMDKRIEDRKKKMSNG